MQILIKKIRTITQEIDLTTLVDSAYSEHLNIIGGVQLSFVITNRLAYFTDILRVKSGDILTATISDENHLEIFGEFRITSIRSLTPNEKQTRYIPLEENDFIYVECLDENCYQVQEKGSDMFHEDTVPSILTKTLPGLSIKTSEYPNVPDYSSYNLKKTLMILKMCSEMASFGWYFDKTFNFKKFDDVWNQDSAMTFEKNEKRLINSIKVTQNDPIRSDSITLDKLKKNYTGYNQEEGFIQSKYFKNYPQVVTNQSSKRVLDNLARAWYPVISIVSPGSGVIRVGKTANHIVHTSENVAQPIDESIESKIIISDVMHYSINNEYLCRTTGIKLLEMHG